MKNRQPILWALVGCAIALIAVAAVSQSQQRVQSTQMTVKTPLVAVPLTEWQGHYDEAIQVARELADEGSIPEARRLFDDLEDVDKALRDYVRASERLRHKNRAYAETMQFLVVENVVQMESRRYQTLSNAAKAAHDVEKSTIRNMRN